MIATDLFLEVVAVADHDVEDKALAVMNRADALLARLEPEAGAPDARIGVRAAGRGRARAGKGKVVRPPTWPVMLFLAVLVAIPAAVALFADDTTAQIAGGIVAGVLALIAGIAAVLVYLKASSVPVKDLIDVLKQAKEVIAELVKLKPGAAGDGQGGAAKPEPGHAQPGVGG